MKRQEDIMTDEESKSQVKNSLLEDEKSEDEMEVENPKI